MRECQAEGIVYAKALWQKAVWKIRKTERRLSWQEQREQGELVRG